MAKVNATADLLVEIGCEELPAKNLKRIEEVFITNFTKGLSDAELTFKKVEAFATPRRLALRINGLLRQQPNRLVLKKGPAKVAAFDETGKPTKAALGFAESCGVSVKVLSIQETEKGAWLVFKQMTKGQSTEKLIPTILKNVLNNLSVGRRMRWGNSDYSFSRPIHWILLLFGNKSIQTEMFGIKTGRLTYGHRFHHPQSLVISSPNQYEKILETKGYVIPNFAKRQAKIARDLLKKRNTFYHNNELLDEVTGLVEWPSVLIGKFEKAFLEIPREVLIASMQTHQKCFPVLGKNKKLLPEFLIVSNIKSKNAKQVIAGNEWVIKARLADAVFYYKVDKETPLQQRRNGLKQVRFQQGLGTLWDKSERMAKLANIIAEKIKADPKAAERAALLCKTDLLTQMVGEFPELQGIMGHYYALQDGESKIVAQAIEDHYYPRFANDILPDTLEGTAVALADRIDSLVGLFGSDNRPTGDKDPFGLRRHALTLLRILVEKKLDLDLKELCALAKSFYQAPLSHHKVVEEVLDFCFERLRAWYQEKDIPTLVFEAVLAKNLVNPFDFNRRILAVAQFTKLKEAESLAAANKRVQNILSKNDLLTKNPTIQNELLQENAEKTLWVQLAHQEKIIAPLLRTGHYTEALKNLATLKDPIDHFFTDVMVMVEDEKLRNNRLGLLSRLRNLFLEIADISLL